MTVHSATHRAGGARWVPFALGAGTQTITGAVRGAMSGTGSLDFDLSMTAAWLINLAVAEYAIRHGRTRSAPSPRTARLSRPVRGPA